MPTTADYQKMLVEGPAIPQRGVIESMERRNTADGNARSVMQRLVWDTEADILGVGAGASARTLTLRDRFGNSPLTAAPVLRFECGAGVTCQKTVAGDGTDLTVDPTTGLPLAASAIRRVRMVSAAGTMQVDMDFFTAVGVVLEQVHVYLETDEGPIPCEMACCSKRFSR